MNWHVFFEQPLSKALQPVYNLLYRTAWLLALGVLLAVLAGMLLARQMVIPIRALQVGAQQLEASDFGHRIEVQTADEIEDLADHFNRMADQLQGSYGRLEQKVEERTRDLAQSISELKALEEIGRAVASSLDTKSVLATIVTRAVQLTQADAGAIYSYDASRDVVRACGSACARPAVPGCGSRQSDQARRKRLGSGAPRSGEPICDSGPVERARTIRSRISRLRPGFNSVLVVPLLGQDEILGALGFAAPRDRRFSREHDRPDADLCPSVGACDEQCAAVSRGRAKGARACDRQRAQVAVLRQYEPRAAHAA